MSARVLVAAPVPWLAQVADYSERPRHGVRYAIVATFVRGVDAITLWPSSPHADGDGRTRLTCHLDGLLMRSA